MHSLIRSVPLAVLVAATSSAQDRPVLTPVKAPAPIHAGTFHVATGQFVPASQQPNAGAARGTSDPVYKSNLYTGFFYDINDGTAVTDEGRLPSLSSPSTTSPVSVTGVANSYYITEVQLGYVTDALTDSTATLEIYDSYMSCDDPSALTPILSLNIFGLPGTINPGALTPYTFDIDMAGFEFCMMADGDGEYSDGISDRFGFRVTMDNTDPMAQIGPIVAARPGTAFAPTGAGTVFRSPGATAGSGLDTVDQWFDSDPVNGDNCFNWGGYDPIDNNPAFGSFWLVLEADLNQGCADCGNGIDDNFEPNDDCSNPAVLAPNSANVDLVARRRNVDSDFYQVTIGPNGILTADVFFSDAEADIDVRLFEVGCGTQLDISQSVTDNEQVEYFNCGDTPVDVILEVYIFNSDASTCGNYDILLTEGTLCTFVDAVEDNDSCNDAAPLSEGTTVNLSVTECDEDYYKVLLAAGETLDITAMFNGAAVDIDIELYDDGPNCGTGAGLLTFSNSVSSTENVFWVNSTGQAQIYVLRVLVFAGGCGNYTLDFVKNDGTQLGSNFCFAETNTSGNGAHIFGTGSDVVADDNFVLNCIFLPANQFGIFFNSQTTIFIPNPSGSDGNICIAGPSIGRFDRNVLFSGPTGFVFLEVDLNMFPTPTSLISVMPGQTWNFQYWFRDISPGGSNFSEALSVTFQ